MSSRKYEVLIEAIWTIEIAVLVNLHFIFIEDGVGLSIGLPTASLKYFNKLLDVLPQNFHIFQRMNPSHPQI